MLDNGTKKRIDSARDILVGKVPDPKSQVEQITIAMIYKFMDDMDNQTEELGGKATFFTGKFKQYAWSRLLDRKFSGHDRLILYAEGLEKMNVNENIPQLFRDIFKGAFLPYRDPETLNLFLKEINGFTYDHSERLGDAFEYLLSIMSSQGDAGQFRTPRHIIDFIVDIVDPGKEDTVLDPACGTAGFLISSYKHIVRQNTKELPGDLLTSDDKGWLMTNFCGYDISPDMVRLSLVNIYLHGFADPKIYEYDALTSEDRWDERYDVIMANPPFMSPKGGIRPHSRFTIKAKRSEVLFVDYIAEHLNVHGKAGVIVPEGIIFQSQNAYKNLRKMLVDEGYLYAVISLPTGVFQPYSGVKTSILLMDKTLAKKCDSILFVKIENDGFDLGAQRRAIEKNDLPQAKQVLHAFHQACAAGEVEAFNAEQFANVLKVQKEKISENGEWNLSWERYRENDDLRKSNYEIVELGEVCQTTSGGTPLKSKDEYYRDGTIPWLRSGEVAQGLIKDSELFITEEGLNNSSAKLLPINTVLIAMYGATAGQVGLLKFESATNQAICGILPCSDYIPEFLFQILKSKKDEMVRLAGGGAQPNISQKIIKNMKIPLPPLEVQEKIVAELDGYQKIIDGAKQIVENYKPTIKINPDWPMVELGKVSIEIKSGFACGKSGQGIEGVPHIRPMNISSNGQLVWEGTKYISEEEFTDKTEYKLKKGDVLFNNTNSKELVGKTCFVEEDILGGYSNHITRIRGNGYKVNQKYLSVMLHYLWAKGVFLEKCHKWVGQAGINNKILSTIRIPLPPLEIQQKIVAEIESERELVEANKKLIEIFEKKIKDKIGEVWGE